MKQSNLQLNYLVPTVVSDGNVLFIRDSDDTPILSFFQIRNQDGDQLLADVVASVTVNSITDLEKLRDTIDETIRSHKNREA